MCCLGGVFNLRFADCCRLLLVVCYVLSVGLGIVVCCVLLVVCVVCCLLLCGMSYWLVVVVSCLFCVVN